MHTFSSKNLNTELNMRCNYSLSYVNVPMMWQCHLGSHKINFDTATGEYSNVATFSSKTYI